MEIGEEIREGEAPAPLDLPDETPDETPVEVEPEKVEVPA